MATYYARRSFTSRKRLDIILLDSNVFIYLANGIIDSSMLGNDDLAFASITKIEVLGYSQITAVEQSYIEELFEECVQLDLDEPILNRAIKLRQRSKMSLGDSIIAATALEEGCELWTANEADFRHITSLNISNPLS